jgi:hypothetical protein
MAAVDSQPKREEIESVFIALPISFPTDMHHLPPILSTSLSCSSVSSIPLELAAIPTSSRKSFSEQPLSYDSSSSSTLHLPPASPSLASSSSTSKISSIFKFLGSSSKTPPPQEQHKQQGHGSASIDRTHSADDRMSASGGSSTAGIERDEYDKDVVLTYNDFIASFLCHRSLLSPSPLPLSLSTSFRLSDQLDRAMVVFRYLDQGDRSPSLPSPSPLSSPLLTAPSISLSR